MIFERAGVLGVVVLPALLALLAVGVGGCISPTDPMGRQDALENSQRDYTKLVRWGDMERAAEFVDPALREAFLSYTEEFAAIRITDFDIGPIHYEADGSARVSVTYHGYSVGTFLDRPIREDQEWYREGRGNAWWVRPEIEGIVGALGAAAP